jgi:exopolysaccharide biosynthesis protein
VLEISLTAPGLSFRVSPGNGADPQETTRQTTWAFMTQQGAQLAINGSFFGTFGANADCVSLAASDGDVYSTFDSGFDALNISSTNVATIVKQASPDFTGSTTNPLVTVYNAVAGNRRLVLNGANGITSPNADDVALEPRTAVGTAPGNKLIILTVDGRQPGVSEGVSTSELANLLIGYGVTQGLNLDGGGSTTMTIADPNPRVLNVPSDGFERAVGNSLAIFASPVPEPGTFVGAFMLAAGAILARRRRSQPA